MRKKDLATIAAMIADGMERAKENGDSTVGIWFVANNFWYEIICFNDKARKWYPTRLGWMRACGFEHMNYHEQS